MLDATELVLIIDRSSSMSSCREEAQTSINNFIKKQSEDGSLTFLTLVEFDHRVETTMHAQKLDKNALPEYILNPNGMTALYDALGKTINLVGGRLRDLNESQRPDKVIVVTITDGEENSSKEFNPESIKSMITHQESVYNWKFVYLGANQDSFLVGSKLGLNSSRTSNYNTRNFAGSCSVVSDNLSSYKLGRSCDVGFSPAERKVIEQDV